MALGMCAARTESALAGMHLVCFAVAATTGGSFFAMARAALLWAMCFAALPMAQLLLSVSPYNPVFSGLPAILCKTYAAHVLAVVFLVLSLLFFLLGRRFFPVPGRRRTARLALFVFTALAVLMLAAVLWFSVADTQADIGEAAAFLRFNDDWGSVRGFAYRRSLRAFADYSPMEKLFGRGMETTLSTLRPYFDDPAMIAKAGGVFNDPHCQLLQMLLTCGLFGMAAFLSFYAAMVRALVRHAGEDPLLVGLLGTLAGYLVVMLINVTQPILIATYFSLCGLALARIRRGAHASMRRADRRRP